MNMKVTIILKSGAKFDCFCQEIKINKQNGKLISASIIHNENSFIDWFFPKNRVFYIDVDEIDAIITS